VIWLMSGNRSFEDVLQRLHGKEVAEPISKYYIAEKNWLKWHEKEVFKGPKRSV
jgi:putative restriction endonuclease